MPFLIPDRILSRFCELTPEYLLSRGIRGLLLDMDNTLIPYEEAFPTDEIIAFVRAMQARGIGVALVSNNRKPRLTRFNETLALPAYSFAGKPLPFTLWRASRALRVPIRKCALMGDQLLTDMIGARLAGMTSFIVPPIRDKQKRLIRLKRRIETPLVRRYRKKNPSDAEIGTETWKKARTNK